MICISDTINLADLASINFLIDDKNNQAGSLTAGITARTVKHNMQQFSGEALHYAEKIIRHFCDKNALIQNYALPKAYTPMRLIRYQEGMYYGKHVDNVIQHNATQGSIRTDISFTVFLSPPESYDGGYLRIHNHQNSHDIKLPAGAMVLYPSDSLHEITPVLSGERVVLVGWIQSYVKDKKIRDILCDLAQSCNMLQLSKSETHYDIHEKVMHSFNRLYRLYCDV
jgi:PKHD-type hydroxylase